MALPELEAVGHGVVTAISPCPPIDAGEGAVVTGRYRTELAAGLIKISFATSDGETGDLTGTEIHPMWSLDRNGWVSLGDVTVGERLLRHSDAAAFDPITQAHWEQSFATVTSVEYLRHAEPVYNLEIGGEHAYAVTACGLVSHNAEAINPMCKTEYDYLKKKKPEDLTPDQKKRMAEYEAGTTGKLPHGGAKGPFRDATPDDLPKKPPYSPDVANWRKNKGKVEIDSNGTWVYTDWDGNVVAYPNGYPDFKSAGMVKHEAPVKQKPDHRVDYDSANKHLGREYDKNTERWHHHESGDSMQLIDKVLHSRFTHKGGFSNGKRK